MDSNKLKKMKELRKKLLDLPEEEFDELLDTSNDIEEWRWYNTMKGKLSNPMHDPVNAKKISELRTGVPREKATIEKIRATNKIKHAGRKNGHYGKGDKYRVTTPEGITFIGTPLDIKEKFGVQPANLREYAQRAKPCTKGKFKGYLFEIVK